MEAIVIGLLEVILYCAIVIFVAWAIVWVLGIFGLQMSGEMLRWGKIIVAVLCLIAVLGFLLSLLPATGVHFPHFIWR